MMRGRAVRVWGVLLAAGWLGAGVVRAQVAGGPGAVPRQDGRLIPRLEWTAPHGELPGTYAEYLEQRPPAEAQFGAAWQVGPAGGALRGQRAAGISILVDALLYPSIFGALGDYAADLAAEGYAVHVEAVAGGTPAQIKSWVQGRYQAGSEGIVFVGDITAAWAEVSGDVFPCDLYYMDLDGTWTDADGDGDFEGHSAGSGDEGPEVYVARIDARRLTYASEPALVRGYLAKARAYRSGALAQPWRGLEYVDEDWWNMDVALRLAYGEDVTRHDYGYYTTAADYLDRLDLGQHFVQVCAHSYSGGHHFGRRPTESAAYAHVYVYSPTARSARLLTGSDDGLKVWLNGAVVLVRDVYGGWTPDHWISSVTLSAGWNRLLCKVSQGGGSYQFSARLTDTTYTTFTDLDYQVNDPLTHPPEAPFIRKWLLNGFHQDISGSFWNYLTTNYLGVSEAGVDPSAGDVMGGKVWTAVATAGPYVDLNAYAGDADYGASYAFVRVLADTAKNCQLWLGYDDGARVWLNGTEIVYDNRYGGYSPDMKKVNVALSAGPNRLLVKVSEWMGASGLSARFCQSDGSAVGGLTYDPATPPVSYIGTWLLSGPYTNPDPATRLSQDYLGGEAGARPSEGDPAPVGVWHRGLGDGYPFDLGAHFDDDGGWVFSQDVQDRDPPVLFYNLFSCGPGRFTDQNYLAGAYIFNTTSGLIAVASAKSGSMLNFHDFTGPLGDGLSIGQAYRAWFEAQAPFEQWEREWYYGMVLCGDPALHPVRKGDLNCDGRVDFDDIDAFVLALGGKAGYQAAYPTCNWRSADCNNDDAVDFADIDPFVALLAG